MNKIEILSPAGTMESFYAAILGGCDAIYLSGYQFGARSYAGNFSMEELKEAIEIAHLYQVKVYVTVNTMIYEREVETLIHYIDELVTFHPDALIIEDIGMFDLIHQRYPQLELHASTQMHLHNQAGVEFAKKIGMKRAVIARETPIEEIKKIRQQVDMPIEVFCHGALCISYSGQCLMSSLIGGRSGNRGTCTQCCRLDYTLCNSQKEALEEGYLLSTKDLNTLDYVGQFIDAGVDSIKIEGRMKRTEYVYYVTYLYRKAVDAYYQKKPFHITEQEIKQLKTLFNRGFTKGFLFHENMKQFINTYRPNHMGIPVGTVTSANNKKIQIQLTDSVSIHDGLRILDKKDVGVVLNEFTCKKERVKKAYKGDIITLTIHIPVTVGCKVVKTTDNEQIQNIRKILKETKRIVPIQGEVICQIGKPITLRVTDQMNQITLQTEQVLEQAQKRPVTKLDIKEKLMKLNDTIYQFENLNITGEEGFIPLSTLNELRRTMVEKLNQLRLQREDFTPQPYQRDVKKEPVVVHHTALVYTEQQYQSLPRHIQEIYAEEELYEKIKQDDRVILKLSNVMRQYPTVNRPVLVCEYGSLMHYQNIIANYNLNVVNSYAVRFLESLGVKRVTLSLECSKEQIEELYDAYQNRYQDIPSIEVIIKTIPVVMSLKYPLLHKYHLKKAYLKRGKDYFPVIQKEHQTDIYFSREIQNQVPDGKKISVRIEYVEEALHS